MFFFNFNYSRGDPHCKDFIILKKQQKEHHHCTKREWGTRGARGLQLRELHRLYNQKQANKVKLGQ